MDEDVMDVLLPRSLSNRDRISADHANFEPFTDVDSDSTHFMWAGIIARGASLTGITLKAATVIMIGTVVVLAAFVSGIIGILGLGIYRIIRK